MSQSIRDSIVSEENELELITFNLRINPKINLLLIWLIFLNMLHHSWQMRERVQNIIVFEVVSSILRDLDNHISVSPLKYHIGSVL